MRTAIILSVLTALSVLTTAARNVVTSQSIAPVTASAAPHTSSCGALGSDERAELNQALEILKGADSPSAVLAQLIADHSEPEASDEQLKAWRESLPPEFKTRLLTAKEVAANPSALRALAVARRVSDVFGFKNRFLMFYHSEKPLLATWKQHFILVSTKAVELLSEAEIAGQIAHETAHLFYLDELNKALQTNDFRAARIIELKCDAVAMMMLEKLKLDSSAVASALAVMIDWLAVRDQLKPAPTHPSLCARQKLSEEFTANFKSNLPVISPAARPAASREMGALYLEARIYYGANDESTTFVPRARFILLNDNLVQILRKNNFTLGAASDAAASTSRPVRARKSGRRDRSGQKNRQVKHIKRNSRQRQIVPMVNAEETSDSEQNAYLTAAVELLTVEFDGPLPKTDDRMNDENAILTMLLEEAIKTHRIAESETNEWGMITFSPLKPGHYYLFGLTSTTRETLVWHLPLKVKPGNNQIELDQYNTAIILEK